MFLIFFSTSTLLFLLETGKKSMTDDRFQQVARFVDVHARYALDHVGALMFTPVTPSIASAH